jgi:hypothetical protein
MKQQDGKLDLFTTTLGIQRRLEQKSARNPGKANTISLENFGPGRTTEQQHVGGGRGPTAASLIHLHPEEALLP